jgi:hypothetical protein
VQAIEAALDRRFHLAEDYGIQGGIVAMIKKYGLQKVSGFSLETVFQRDLEAIKKEVVAKKTTDKDKSISWQSRHLSILESPYRSCLGASDCSSRNYPRAAFDSNFHYFTRTSSSGFSSGHITAVLGEAIDPETSQKVPVGFVDKVQNIPTEDIPYRIEAARRSAASMGYTLALKEDEDPSDHNGISNQPSVSSSVVATYLAQKKPKRLEKFKPHESKGPVDYSKETAGGYSRAYEQPNIIVIPELAASSDWKMTQADTHQSFRVELPDMEEMKKSTFALKNGGLDERLRYLGAMTALRISQLGEDPEFGATLRKWAIDTTQDISFRKKILGAQLLFFVDDVAAGLKAMSVEERESWIESAIQKSKQDSNYAKYLKMEFKELISLVEHKNLGMRLLEFISQDEKLRFLAEGYKESDPQIQKILELMDESPLPEAKYASPTKGVDLLQLRLFLKYRRWLKEKGRLPEYDLSHFLTDHGSEDGSRISDNEEISSYGNYYAEVQSLLKFFIRLLPSTPEEKTQWKILLFRTMPGVLNFSTEAHHPVVISVLDLSETEKAELRKKYYEKSNLDENEFVRDWQYFGLKFDEIPAANRASIMSRIARKKRTTFDKSQITQGLLVDTFNELEASKSEQIFKREKTESEKLNISELQIKLRDTELPDKLIFGVLERDILPLAEKDVSRFIDLGDWALTTSPPHEGYRQKLLKIIDSLEGWDNSVAVVHDRIINWASYSDNYHAIPGVHEILRRIVDPTPNEKPVWIGILMRILSFGIPFMDANPEYAKKIRQRIEGDWQQPDLMRRYMIMKAFGSNWANNLEVKPPSVVYENVASSLRSFSRGQYSEIVFGDWARRFLDQLEVYRKNQKSVEDQTLPPDLKTALHEFAAKNGSAILTFYNSLPSGAYEHSTTKMFLDDQGIQLRFATVGEVCRNLVHRIQKYLP